MQTDDGRGRVIIENVDPEIDGGRFPVKRTVGESLEVEADIYTDGHDAVAAFLLHRKDGAPSWTETEMSRLVNDRWRGQFTVTGLGRYQYILLAWVDRFATWRRDLEKRVGAGQDVEVDLLIGAKLLGETAGRARGEDAVRLREAQSLLEGRADSQEKAALALSAEIATLVERYPDKRFAVRYHRELPVEVDRERARFSAWYEMFPRSCSGQPGRHGTFKDCEQRLDYVAGMGFDVLYLPPIHPVGRLNRKGKNNATSAGAEDTGSPWAIGSREGGHKAVHPQLGSLEDFRNLVQKAGEHGLEVAMDLAFQCAPDHPYVKEHPEWFRLRPDGSIQYSENPPKKYQDIYPFDFETETSGEVTNRYSALLGRKITAMRTRCHGDYHLGQLLYTGRDFMVIDFEGEPSRTLSERRLKRTPLRDVAGMLRSFHYAAYSALFDLQSRGMVGRERAAAVESWASFWYAWVRAVFLDAYIRCATPAVFLPAESRETRILLDAFVLDKAIYEMVYELNNRPSWLRIPLSGIRAVLEESEVTT